MILRAIKNWRPVGLPGESASWKQNPFFNDRIFLAHRGPKKSTSKPPPLGFELKNIERMISPI